MYNRYVPQPDGTYKRKAVNSQLNMPSPVLPRHEVHRDTPPGGDTSKYLPKECNERPKQRRERPSTPTRHEKSAASFLRDLLPRDLDAGDLLVVILLLLISADNSGEEQSNALLTLALYLFM